MKEFSNKYLSLLLNDYKTLNLTRITDPKEFYVKQILDSIKPLEHFSFVSDLYKNSKFCLDVGFGGGFPLLPLAKRYPQTKFYGFEARRKKADAVREIAEKLELKNVKTFHHRIESIEIDRASVVSFKAVGKIKDYLSKITATKVSHIVFYKGPNVEELEDVPMSYRGFSRVFFEKYELEETEGRSIIIYKGKNVPRGTQNNLVKLSVL